MTKTSVVILNYNGEKFLRQFLPSVITHSTGADVIVADNASTDGSRELLRKEFPGVTLIPLSKNYGFCGGYNRALAEVQTQYSVLLNSDVEVTPGWLKPLEALLDAHHDIAAVQPKILSFYQRNQFEYAGAGGGFIDKLGYPFCRGRIFNSIEKDEGQYNDERSVFWGSGACLMIRTAVYHDFEGLDEDFFAHMEEIDLCWRIQRSNMKIFYCGKSSVYHVGAGTLGYENPRKTYLNFKNNLTMLIKNMSRRELLLKLPFRILLDWIAALAFIFQGKFRNAMSVFDAHISMLQSLSSTLDKRRQILGRWPDYSRSSISNKLLLFEYYFGSRKRLHSIVPDGVPLA